MKKIFGQTKFFLTIFFILAMTCLAGQLSAQETEIPFYLQDRGSGLPTSMFATFINQGEFITYLFFEYYLDHDMEYKPAELGYGLEQDFRGQYSAAEGLIFMAYGITDWLALELEAAVITASLQKSDDDPSAMPDKLEESGLGDVEGQLRLRWLREGEYWPELFSYFETVFPLQPDNVLIGTQDWEFKLGSGISKGFSFGTLTLRAAIEYDTGENKLDLGEYALEYVKRLSPYWRIYAGVEGEQDEVELIAEVQWHIIPDKVILKLNSAFGLTPKATDWAPEAGIMVYW
jgi:hypothetical protein